RILRSLMAVSPLQRAKRAFVIVLQSIAAAYSVQLDVTRESADNLVTSAFRRVAKKVHPDKGGKLVDSQRLLAARQLWEDALRAASANGRPVSGKSSATSSSQFSLSWAAESRREFRIQSEAALLTYQGFNGLDHWRRFVSFVGSSFKRWRVKHWCATLETNTDGTDHAHLMLQFLQVVDRTTRSFMFEGLRPNVATTDLGGEGAQCLAGNYGPVWSTEPFRYQVLGAWPEKLWKQRKLSHEVCRNYLFLTRDGVCFRKRNLEAAREHELGLAEDAEIEATTKRLRSNPSLYKAFPQRAKRAFVIVLQSIAAAYSVQLDVTRESADNLVTSAFRRVAKKVHPDKGGKLVDSQRLLAARQLWEDALRAAKLCDLIFAIFSFMGCRSEAALLTYQGFNGLDHWRRFVSFVGSSFKRWRVKHWCATLETNTDGTDHAHLMLQFLQVVDRTTRSFMFEGLRPNVATTDLGGEGFCKKRMQQSINRGMFYVWANKVGTQLDETGAQCLAGNYGPVWSTEPFRYQVLGAWPEKLWKQRKLSHEVCRNYLFLTRDGVCFRKRNLEAAREHELGLAEDAEIEATTKRLRSNPSLYKAFPQVPVASQWLESFKKDSLRYAILVVMGPSFSGKTEWASSLFKNPLELKVGTLPHFPDKMRLFDRNKHDAIILDDIRDMAFLGDRQEKLQGKYNAKVEFASTLGGTCAYSKYLFQVPIVATVNFSTKNLDFLETHDWLKHASNRVMVNISGPFTA
ncbi:unnamed protein product, partial [Polarella glacialis]